MADELRAGRLPRRTPEPIPIPLRCSELLDRLAALEADADAPSATDRLERTALRRLRDERLPQSAELFALEDELRAAHRAFRQAVAGLPEQKRLIELRRRINALLGRGKRDRG